MKKISQYIPLHLSLFLTVGVLIGYYFLIPIKIALILISISVSTMLLLLLIRKKKPNKNWILQLMSYMTIFLIGAIRISSQHPSQIKKHYSHHVSQENQLVIQIDKKLKPTAYQDKYYAQVIQIDSTPCTGKIVISSNKDSLVKPLKVGEVYTLKTTLQEINKALNPYSFDYSDYLKKQGIIHQLSVTYPELKKVKANQHSLKIYAAKWRSKIQSSLQKYPFDENEMAIINAIILGQRQSISKDLLNSYAGAGAIHILAVSGLHVGILFLLLNFLFKPIERLPKGNYLKTSIIILILWNFALLTGLSGSVVRAVTMFSFIAIGLAMKNQRSPVLHALITSYFFLVLIYPLFLFDVGFQMSYAAVLGIVLLQPEIEKLIPRSRWFFTRKIGQLLSVSIAATIGTLPISLYYFHQFPGLFFVSNVVIIPFIGLIMSIGLLVVFLALLDLLPSFLVDLYGGILHYMNSFIEWIASHESFLFKDISFSIWALLSSYFLISMAYRFWLNKKLPQLTTFLMAILLFQSVLLYEKYQTENSNELVLFHKTKESLIGIKTGRDLTVLHSLDSIQRANTGFINAYQVGLKLSNLETLKTIPNCVDYQHQKILVIDSLGIFQNNSFQPDIIVLRQSPKINLERLLKEQPPKMLIADGSNYKTYVNFWRLTCLKDNIAFHYTGIDGAFVLK